WTRTPVVAANPGGPAIIVYARSELGPSDSARFRVVARLLTPDAACAGGACPGASCVPGFGNCDGVATNGCEASLRDDPANCGACGHACAAGASCLGAACMSLAPPRPIAPLSTATVTSRRPTLRWALSGGDGARVVLCRDRALTVGCVTFDAAGGGGAPPAELAAGVWFWRLAARTGGVTSDAVGPTWQFTVGARSAPVDTSWGTTLDVNGDGYADVVIGAPNAHAGAGAAYLYLGGAGGLSTSPAASLSSPNPTGFSFGHSVSSAGDVNGDGYGDVIIGGYGEQVLVYLGSARGLVEAPASNLTVPENGSFGWSVAGAGDINGDGYADVVVGAPLAGSLGRPLAGQAYVFLGSAGGVATTPATTVPGTGGEYGQFGSAVVGVGDVNGDGYGDVVINALLGPAHVYLGGAAGLATEPAAALLGLVPQPVNVAGAGDVNGDGYADVLTAAAYFGNATGVVSLFLGSATGLPSTPATTLSGPDSVNGAYGTSIASAGDVDGDGYAEIAIGAPGATSATGRVHVYFGGAGGLVTTHVNSPTGLDGPNGYFGTSLAGAGDVNGDGHADLVVGAYPVNAYTGRAYLFAGGAAGVPNLPATTLIGPDGPDGWFGAAVARAEDRHGRARRVVDRRRQPRGTGALWERVSARQSEFPGSATAL
ncbi:MAG: hypothetical protein JWM10_2732, partial [Myxococcaceae bacterium]|nr:hypothetical protein [Myxococcaceae bacterium]